MIRYIFIYKYIYISYHPINIDLLYNPNPLSTLREVGNDVWFSIKVEKEGARSFMIDSDGIPMIIRRGGLI